MVSSRSEKAGSLDSFANLTARIPFALQYDPLGKSTGTSAEVGRDAIIRSSAFSERQGPTACFWYEDVFGDIKKVRKKRYVAVVVMPFALTHARWIIRQSEVVRAGRKGASDVPLRPRISTAAGWRRGTPSCPLFSRPDGVVFVGSRSRTKGGGHFVFCSALGGFQIDPVVWA